MVMTVTVTMMMTMMVMMLMTVMIKGYFKNITYFSSISWQSIAFSLSLWQINLMKKKNIDPINSGQ